MPSEGGRGARSDRAGALTVSTRFTADVLAMMERLHTAALTVACLPSDGPKGFFSTWPRYKLDWWDAEDWGSQRTDQAVTARLIAPPRFAPTPQQVDDCLPALALLDGLQPLHRRVIRLRAHQLWYGEHAAADEDYAHWRGGWRMIGKACGVSHERARGAHRDAVLHAFARSTARSAA